MEKFSSRTSLAFLRIYSALFICISISLLLSRLVNAQQVLVHELGIEAYTEDGYPQNDADGVKNGVVVWKSGAIHVLRGSYRVGPWGSEPGAKTLIVEPGAIIKAAGEFYRDANGKLIWSEPSGKLDVSTLSTIKLDGVTITDIRDDEIGGDTNEDGSASKPSTSLAIYLSGSSRDILQNSLIKYGGWISNIGSIKITKNRFLNIRGNLSPAINSDPVIADNVFEFAATNAGLNFSGSSPVIEGNKIRGGYGIGIGSYFNYTVGGPVSGTSIVINNVIEECTSGITCIESGYIGSDSTLFKAIPPCRFEIRNNIIKGTNAYLGVGIWLSTAFTGDVLYNEVSNFETTLAILSNNLWEMSNRQKDVSGLRINYNKFILPGSANPNYYYGDSIGYKYWGKGKFVNAQFNYWGDPTGPLDKSNKDGLYNPYGKGLKLGNGIDYRNYIGASKDPIPNYIKIEVLSSPLEPLIPTETVTFNVNVTDYKLTSSKTGKIVIVIRDECGMILNGRGTMIDITDASRTLTVPPISVKLPIYLEEVKAEAALAPDGNDALTVYSNPVMFEVAKLQSSFKITDIIDADNNIQARLTTASKYKLRFDLLYTLSGSENG